jgi:glycosyltransferase involved in cell wall biosynthesis
MTDRSPDDRLTVAAIIPLYNNRDTVIEAIQSVSAQTRAVDEIIVVDDGSTDGSAELVEQVFGNRVRVIRRENRGPAAARNTAIHNCGADLIAFLDADDRWLPTRVEKQAGLMESQPKCMFSFSAHLQWSERENETRVLNAEIDRNTFLRKEFFRGQCFIATDSIMIRRHTFDECGLFDESLQVGEDGDLWLRIMARFGFDYIAEPLVWIRRSVRRDEKIARDLDRDYALNERLYAKHRYVFGKTLAGWATWRDGWGFSLRYQARQFLNCGRRGKSMAVLLRGIVAWPFAAPALTARLLLKILLGKNLYETSCDLLGTCRSAFRWNRLPRRYNNR